jgi:spore germination protein YaaH
LTVNVYAKTSEPGTWDGPKAQDWTAIGNVADQVRIMTYEYHWSTSDAGPIAPVDWVDQVLSFARSVIPAHKIMEGVPLYGYDWTGRSGAPIVFEAAMALSAQRALAGSHPIGGVTLWRLGGEDPAAWLALRSRFKGGAARGNSSVAEITASR